MKYIVQYTKRLSDMPQNKYKFYIYKEFDKYPEWDTNVGCYAKN